MPGMVGNQCVGTATISTSGSVTLNPALSNTVFKNLCITIQPIDLTVAYQVDVYMYGELSETHTFPDVNNKVIAVMTYPDVLFPANVGTDSIPKYYVNKEAPPGLPVSIKITNNSSAEKTFVVYCTFESFQAGNCAFKTMPKVRD